MKQILLLLLLGGVILSSAPADAQVKHLTGIQADKRYAAKQKRLHQTKVSKGLYAPVQPFASTATLKGTPFDRQAKMRPVRHRNVVRADAVYTPDWRLDFDSEDNFSVFTVIDVDGDASEAYNGIAGTWSFYPSGAGYRWSDARNPDTDQLLPGDDYLVSPGIQLEADKDYLFKFGSSGTSDFYTERLEVKYGKAPTVEGLNQILVEPIEIRRGHTEDTEVRFSVPESGVYYFAFHAISDPDTYILYVDYVAVEVAPDLRSPGEVTDIVIIPDADGAPKALLSLKAPTVNRGGNELESVWGVLIQRDGDDLIDVKRMSPGSQVDITDNYLSESGLYTYKFIPYNEYGNGIPVEAEGYVGLDAPQPVLNPVLTDDGGKGFTLKWSVPESQHGGAFKPEELIYQVVTVEQRVNGWWYEYYPDRAVSGELKNKTQFSMDYPMDEGEPGYLPLGVWVENEAGYGWDVESSYQMANVLWVGAPFATPYTESISGGADSRVFDNFWFNGGFYTVPGYYATDEGDEYKDTGIYYSADAADGDSGAVEFVVNYYDPGNEGIDSLYLQTWKLTLDGTVNPELVFARKFTSDLASPSAELFAFGTTAAGDVINLGTRQLTTNDEGWVKERFDLSQLMGAERYVQVAFGLKATSPQAELVTQRLLVDNIHIGDMQQVDLAVGLTATESLMRGEKGQATVVVKNHGDQDVEAFKLKLTAGDTQVVDYNVVSKVPSLGCKTLTYEFPTDVLNRNAMLTVKVEVAVDGDATPTDNMAEAEVKLTSPELATVSNLAIEKNEGGDTPCVTLTWTAPDNSQPVSKIEDFENGQGGFTTIDADGDGYNWTYHYNDGNTGNIEARSGNGKMYSESYSNTYGALEPDNWLVTPLSVLDGTFEFWAYAQDPQWCDEHFAVYVSTTSNTDPDSFTQVTEEFVASSDQDLFTADLSSFAGVQGYVAIRHFNVSDMFYLIVDDVAYTAMPPGGEPQYYLVYRDGVLIGETTETSYTDNEVSDGDHTYQVAVVYETGDVSAAVAVDIIFTDIERPVSPAQPLDVYSLGGVELRHGVNSVSGLAKGIYVVNNKKVVIK